MPPELDALQLEERLVGSRVRLEAALGHRHSEPDDVIFSRLSPLLQRHGGVGGVLVRDRPELAIRPLEHDGALRAGLVICLQEDFGGIREIVTVLSYHVQTDGTPTVLRGGPNKDNLIGYTVRPWRWHPHFPAGRHFSLLVLCKLTLCLCRFASQCVVTTIE